MVKLLLIGFGSVNQGLLDILIKKELEIKSLLKDEIVIVGASDSMGAIYNENGFNISELLSIKKKRKSVIFYEENGCKMYVDALTMIKDKRINYDIIIDGSPVNMRTGEPGKQCALFALQHGKRVVLANKAPLVLAFEQLHKYSENLRYSATVCGGLPVVNILRHDLMAPHVCTVSKVLGIFNSTTNYILDELTQHCNDASVTMNSALLHAQKIGIAETDPSLDVNGSDTANKLCIIMNILGEKVAFADIDRSGLETVNKKMIANALKEGKVYKMIARADKNEKDEWMLSVRCAKVGRNSFLGQCQGTDMAVQFETDLFDTQYYKTDEKDVVGTSAAVLRDIMSLCLNDQMYSTHSSKL